MATVLNEAIDVLIGNIKSTTEGGTGTHLSAISKPFFEGSGVGHYTVVEMWSRFFELAWEIPISRLSGATSTGVIFVVTGNEKNLENNLDQSLKYRRDLKVQLIPCFFDEGTRTDYEEIIDALMRDALKDPYLNRKILDMKWKEVERVRPAKLGVCIALLEFSLQMKTNLT
jgi:hypothetical protein